MQHKIYKDVQWTGNAEVDALLAMTAWTKSARPAQLPNLNLKYGYLFLAGRGYGKSQVLSATGFKVAWENPGIRIAVVCRTGSDARGTLFLGDSGLLNNVPTACIASFTLKPLELKLTNGSTFYGFSAEEPTGLRGPAFGFALCDELAFWSNLGAGLECPFSMIRIATRMPTSLRTKILIATTPDEVPTLFSLVDDPQYITVSGSTLENTENLDETYINEIIPSLMEKEGTAFADLEIRGILRPRDSNVMFRKEWFCLWPREKKWPKFIMILQSWDTAFSESTAADFTAVTTWGVFHTEEMGFGIMLIDAWQERMNYPNLKSTFVEQFQRGHGPDGKLFISSMVLEIKGSGLSLYQDLSTSGIPIQAVSPIGRNGQNDKITRASIVSYLAEQGKIWIPEDSSRPKDIPTWADAWMAQMTQFSLNKKARKSQKDDYVDSTVNCWRWVIDNGIGRMTPESLDRKRIISQNTNRTFKNPYLR